MGFESSLLVNEYSKFSVATFQVGENSMAFVKLALESAFSHHVPSQRKGAVTERI